MNQPPLEDALRAARAALRYYSGDNRYATGRYCLVSEDGRFVVRDGAPLRYRLYDGDDGLKAAYGEVSSTYEQRRYLIEHDLGVKLRWIGHVDAIRQRIRQIEAAQDAWAAEQAHRLYGDASGAAQSFDANEGRYL